MLTYYCSDVLGACAHIRIKAEDIERYLLEEIQHRLTTAPLPVFDDPVRLPLRLQQHQLQDDHYDHLLNRADYVRQDKRLAARVADRRRELTGGWQRAHVEPIILTAEPSDLAPKRRAALRHHLVRVEVDPHPRGRRTAAASGWDRRRRGRDDPTAPYRAKAKVLTKRKRCRRQSRCRDRRPWVSPG